MPSEEEEVDLSFSTNDTERPALDIYQMDIMVFTTKDTAHASRSSPEESDRAH